MPVEEDFVRNLIRIAQITKSPETKVELYSNAQSYAIKGDHKKLASLCAAEIKINEAFQTHDRRKKIELYESAAKHYDLAGNRKAASFNLARAKKLMGIEAHHELKFDEAKQFFLEAQRLLESEGYNASWPRGALLECEAMADLHRLGEAYRFEIKEYERLADLFQKASKEYTKERTPDQNQIKWCETWSLICRFFVAPDRNLTLLEKAKQSLQEIEQSSSQRNKPPSRRREFRDRVVLQAIILSHGRWAVEKLNTLLESGRGQYVKYLISKGEDESTEFKSSLRWDLKLNRENRDLQKEAIKTICAFMNVNGGNLLLGVGDKREPLGLEKDIATMKNKNKDGFGLCFADLVNDYLGEEYSEYAHLSWEDYEGKEIALIKVDSARSSGPVFFRGSEKSEFIVRTGNQDRSLDAGKTYEYIQHHWPGPIQKRAPDI